MRRPADGQMSHPRISATCTIWSENASQEQGAADTTDYVKCLLWLQVLIKCSQKEDTQIGIDRERAGKQSLAPCGM